MTISAVVFDYFGTLTPAIPSRVWDEHAARSAAALGIPAAAWRRALEETYPERAAGALGDLKSTFRTLALRCGVRPSAGALAAACAARRTSQREMFRLREDAPGVLAAVRARGLPVGVLSDCTMELAEDWPGLPVAGLVDARVLSCEAGLRKPAPELFMSIARQLGARPEECLYIGDGGGDELAGASRCGMTAYLLRGEDWPLHGGRGGQREWHGPSLPCLPAVLPLLAGAGRPGLRHGAAGE